MEKPSVTIQYRTVYWVGLVTIVCFSLMGVLGMLQTPLEERWEMVGLTVILECLGLMCVTVGSLKEVLDETGVRTELWRWSWNCPWSEVLEVGIAKMPRRQRTFKDLCSSEEPKILIIVPRGTPRTVAGDLWSLKNILTGYELDYRKEMLDCVLYYYGDLDFDEWGQPPTLD